ncbi:MAG: hypothetical protein KDC07_11845 [Chitinophagaceae bacterium]|nr:hypothetical protein [Chitinophagaceae bacterium]MCB9046410.1 hypothetical protein [Chitinophagales bacterium]
MKKLLTIWVIVVAFVSCKRDKIGYTVPVVNPTQTYDNRSVGLSANDFLSAAKYKAINVQFCNVNKHPFPDSVVQAAVAFLDKYCHKPNGIYVSYANIPLQGGNLYVNDLINIEKQYREQFQVTGEDGIDTLGLFILLTEGDYYEKNILGVAYKNTSVALFGGIIDEHSGAEGQPTYAAAMTAVLEHELGHIFGLVNLGSALQSNHQDEANGKHCDVPGCLMNYQMQTTDYMNVFTGEKIPELDPKCLDDLRANGGK